jgi:hypothetical protein
MQIGCENVDWIQLAQDRVQWRVFCEYGKINLRVPHRRIILTLLHEITLSYSSIILTKSTMSLGFSGDFFCQFPKSFLKFRRTPPWTEGRPVTMSKPTQHNTEECGYASMPRVGFEPTRPIPYTVRLL